MKVQLKHATNSFKHAQACLYQKTIGCTYVYSTSCSRLL